MQNAKIKCGLQEDDIGILSDNISSDALIWYESNWKHDDYDHRHQRSQLSFVEEGYQYFYIGQKIYLVPQNHVIWIPSQVKHRIYSNATEVNLRVVMYKEIPQDAFYTSVHVFSAPPVLREMLLYASKWNKMITEDEERLFFLKAILKSLPGFFLENQSLEIPIPTDERLLAACNYINENYDCSVGAEELAEKASMSVRNLQRIFKHDTGISLQKYIQMIRILKSIEMIESGNFTLSEIAVRIGYKSLSAFTTSYLSIMKTKAHVRRKTK